MASDQVCEGQGMQGGDWHHSRKGKGKGVLVQQRGAAPTARVRVHVLTPANVWDVCGSHLPLVLPLWRLQGVLLLSSQMPGLTRDAGGRIILCPQVCALRGGDAAEGLSLGFGGERCSAQVGVCRGSSVGASGGLLITCDMSHIL